MRRRSLFREPWEYQALRGILQATLIIMFACAFVWLFVR